MKKRKVNTSERKKERKLAQKNLQKKVASMLNMPTECAVCRSAFDKKSREMANTWRVTVYEQKNKIYLTCPQCQEKVNKLVEENYEQL